MNFEFWIRRGRELLWIPMFRKELCVAFRLCVIRVICVKNVLAKNLLVLFNNRTNHNFELWIMNFELKKDYLSFFARLPMQYSLRFFVMPKSW